MWTRCSLWQKRSLCWSAKGRRRVPAPIYKNGPRPWADLQLRLTQGKPPRCKSHHSTQDPTRGHGSATQTPAREGAWGRPGPLLTGLSNEDRHWRARPEDVRPLAHSSDRSGCQAASPAPHQPPPHRLPVPSEQLSSPSEAATKAHPPAPVGPHLPPAGEPPQLGRSPGALVPWCPGARPPLPQQVCGHGKSAFLSSL